VLDQADQSLVSGHVTAGYGGSIWGPTKTGRHGLLMSASPSMGGGNRGLWALHEPGAAVDVTARIKRRQVVDGPVNEYRRAA